MMLYEMAMENQGIEISGYSKLLEHVDSYLIEAEYITLTEAKKLLQLCEGAMHQDVAEVKSKWREALDKLKRWYATKKAALRKKLTGAESRGGVPGETNKIQDAIRKLERWFVVKKQALGIKYRKMIDFAKEHAKSTASKIKGAYGKMGTKTKVGLGVGAAGLAGAAGYAAYKKSKG